MICRAATDGASTEASLTLKRRMREYASTVEHCDFDDSRKTLEAVDGGEQLLIWTTSKAVTIQRSVLLLRWLAIWDMFIDKRMKPHRNLIASNPDNR